MSMYTRFLKSAIDLSPVGLIRRKDNEPYFCTPRNARILGWAGVDGLHYCTVSNFGEMVFAVSPMNLPGEYVHPIARNIQELLGLILACGDLSAAEQAHGWSREAFDRFLAEYPPTEEQRAVQDAIREEFGVEAIEDPYGYLRQLAEDFDYGRIRYSKEYYETVADAPLPPWEVSFQGGFWGGSGQPGKEIAIGREFRWGDAVWRVPAVYACEEGMVADFCIQVQPEEIQRFLDKWYPLLQQGIQPDREMERQIRAENPLERPDFHPELFVNDQQLRSEGGCGMSWIPRALQREDMEDRTEGEDLIGHYALDENMGWCFHRARFRWETVMDPETIKVQLKARPETFYGPAFPTPEIGEQIALTHPVTGTVHTLTVQDVQRGVFEKEIPTEGIEEWPRQYLSLEYTLSPDLNNHQFALRDTVESDRPRIKANLAGCVGIIGGSDGPTAIIFSQKSSHPHGAVSSLHFDPPEQVLWQAEFREKMVEDLTITLL